MSDWKSSEEFVAALPGGQRQHEKGGFDMERLRGSLEIERMKNFQSGNNSRTNFNTGRSGSSQRHQSGTLGKSRNEAVNTRNAATSNAEGNSVKDYWGDNLNDYHENAEKGNGYNTEDNWNESPVGHEISNDDNAACYWDNNNNGHYNGAHKSNGYYANHYRDDNNNGNGHNTADYWGDGHHNSTQYEARGNSNRGAKNIGIDNAATSDVNGAETGDYCAENPNGPQNAARSKGNRTAADSYWGDTRNTGENGIPGNIPDPNGEICPHCRGTGLRNGDSRSASNRVARNVSTADDNNRGNDGHNGNKNGGHYFSRSDGEHYAGAKNYAGDSHNEGAEGARNGKYGPSRLGHRRFRTIDDGIPREFYIPPLPTDDENEIFNMGIISGTNFAKFDRIPVKRSGDNLPPTITTFQEARFSDTLFKNVQRSGYTVPTPVQKAAIPVILAGRDLMACAQTGSGKTAAYLLPIISVILNLEVKMRVGRPPVLIISPTRELGTQIFNEARKFAYGTFIRISVIYGGTSFIHQTNIVRQGCHILIATPGRLTDFFKKDIITFDGTLCVVLDEADRMLDMGFGKAINDVMNHITMRTPEARQTLMFSATFPDQIQHMASEYLNNYVFITVGTIGGANRDVLQLIHEVKKEEKLVALKQLLIENADGTLVFVDTKRNADFLGSILYDSAYTAASIHGDRLQRHREEALNDFKTGRIQILIATSVAARGLDISNVRHVVNYDLPKDINEYVHRIGRTGRIGNYGKATSFFDPDTDIPLVNDLIRVLEDAGQDVPVFLRYYGTEGSDPETIDFGAVDVRGNSVLHERTEMWE